MSWLDLLLGTISLEIRGMIRRARRKPEPVTALTHEDVKHIQEQQRSAARPPLRKPPGKDRP